SDCPRPGHFRYSLSSFFSLLIPPPPSSTLFPYTTLFRSRQGAKNLGAACLRSCGLNGAWSFLPSLSIHRMDVARLIGGRKNCSRSEEHTSELQSLRHLVCRLLLEKKK